MFAREVLDTVGIQYNQPQEVSKWYIFLVYFLDLPGSISLAT